MATWEITLVYPEQDFDEVRSWVASLIKPKMSSLDGVRKRGSGVALTYIINGDMDRDTAIGMARQEATSVFTRSRPRTVAALHVQDFPGAQAPLVNGRYPRWDVSAAALGISFSRASAPL